MTNHRLKAVDGLWLGIALALHLALLLVPVNIPPELSPTTETLTVTVTLDTRSKDVPPIDQPVKYQPEINPERRPQSVPQEPQDVQQLDPLLFSAQDLSAPITTAQLLRSVRHLKPPQPESEKALELGTFRAPPLPANWLPSLKIDDNLFNGTVTSGGSEIVDQWGGADGRYNVVVKTSTGHTLCGQAQAWSPMNPLEEHVTMWRSCGGNGKRTSERPHRKMYTSD
jgi:hypothetical protein